MSINYNAYIYYFYSDMVTRPVLIIGPLSDVVVEKLTGDYPHKFAKCEPEPMTCNQETLEKGIMSNMNHSFLFQSFLITGHRFLFKFFEFFRIITCTFFNNNII